jgi:type VII secretion protein EccB
MPSTPTTKSQVQAYKFVLRRMQSALVRRDAVMLHDPMRTHTRATVVGVCLGAVGLVGFLIWGLLSPAPTLPDSGIVISKESGSIYVLTKEPRQLIPTFNLASARLLLLAQSQGNQAGQPQGGSAPAGAGTVEQPTVVSDKDLAGVPKGRLMGIQDGPQLLPGDDQRPPGDWAVCDAYQLNTGLEHSASDNNVETTVLSGVHDLGQPLDEQTALLVKSDNGKTYLVYHLTTSPNFPNTDTVRAEVDLANSNLVKALQLAGNTPRRITTGLLNAIPEVRPLAAPPLAGQGGPSSVNLNNLTVGTVFSVQNAGEPLTFWVVEKDGIQQIKETTADLIRYNTGAAGGADIVPVRPGDIGGLRQSSAINEDGVPTKVPTVLVAERFPVSCLGWSIPAGQTEGHTSVYVDDVAAGVPLPKGLPQGYKGVRISTPTADHLKVDYFFMPPGKAAVVRGSASSEDYRFGPIYLVSDRGVKFGVPDSATAAALGLGTQVPAPDSIVRLLPDGSSLDTRKVLQSYDTLPPRPGTYETPSASAAPGAPGGG